MTTPALTPAALETAWRKLPYSEQQRLIARAILEQEPAGGRAEKLLNRAEAAKRLGYSRSWLHGFLRDHWASIPEALRPDKQCASNRISVAFVAWFNREGHRLPRKRPAPALVSKRATAPRPRPRRKAA